MKLPYGLGYAVAACTGRCESLNVRVFPHWRKNRQYSGTNGKSPGWEYMHVCIDDASSAAYTAILPDETAENAIEFLWFAVAWYASHGIKVERVLTDNRACYKSWKFRDAWRELGIKHKRTRPYRPQTNGKAERFIRTALKEWAYAETYTHSWKRIANLPIWTQRYNFQRPYSALGRKPPASRLLAG